MKASELENILLGFGFTEEKAKELSSDINELQEVIGKAGKYNAYEMLENMGVYKKRKIYCTRCHREANRIEPYAVSQCCRAFVIKRD